MVVTEIDAFNHQCSERNLERGLSVPFSTEITIGVMFSFWGMLRGCIKIGKRCIQDYQISFLCYEINASRIHLGCIINDNITPNRRCAVAASGTQGSDP